MGFDRFQSQRFQPQTFWTETSMNSIHGQHWRWFID